MAQTAHIESERHKEAAAERALEAGAALVEAKALCKHGTWADWLKGTGISERSAQRYMRLHRSGLESAIVADLGVAQADRIAGVIERAWPEPGRGRFIGGERRDEQFWAVIYRPSQEQFAFYGSLFFHGDDFTGGGRTMTQNKPIAPLLLGLGHLSEANGIPIKEHHDIAPEDIDGWFETVRAKLVRRRWGARLEPLDHRDTE